MGSGAIRKLDNSCFQSLLRLNQVQEEHIVELTRGSFTSTLLSRSWRGSFTALKPQCTLQDFMLPDQLKCRAIASILCDSSIVVITFHLGSRHLFECSKCLPICSLRLGKFHLILVVHYSFWPQYQWTFLGCCTVG